MRWAAQAEKRWTLASQSWLCVLAMPGLILRNNSKPSNKQWFLSLGVYGGQVVWAWPVKESVQHGVNVWRVAVGGVVTFDLPMLTFDLPMLTFDLPWPPFCRNKRFFVPTKFANFDLKLPKKNLKSIKL